VAPPPGGAREGPSGAARSGVAPVRGGRGRRLPALRGARVRAAPSWASSTTPTTGSSSRRRARSSARGTRRSRRACPSSSSGRTSC
jgi:hypothetical protein